MSNPRNIDINPITSRSYLIGALAGVISAILMGIVALLLGRILANLTERPTPNTLLEIASIIRSTSPVVGFGLHLMIGAVLGVGFVFLIGSRLQTDKSIILWGFIYGTTWTLIGTPQWSGLEWCYPSISKSLIYFYSAIIDQSRRIWFDLGIYLCSSHTVNQSNSKHLNCTQQAISPRFQYFASTLKMDSSL
jgi:hypothetical protein